MFRKYKGRLLGLALILIAGLIIAAKPAGITHLTSLWIGDATDTADVTPGANDVFISGTLEVDGAVRFDGGTYLPVTLNTTATAITLTAADSGQLFYENTSGLTAGGVPIVYTLPADPTGLTFTFALGTSSNQVAVNPAAGDTISGGTMDYYLWADAASEAVTLKGVNSSLWVIVNSVGSWTSADDS